jgi:hypothetical protein
VSGRVKDDKVDMLATIDAFLGLPEKEHEAGYPALGSHT